MSDFIKESHIILQLMQTRMCIFVTTTLHLEQMHQAEIVWMYLVQRDIVCLNLV